MAKKPFVTVLAKLKETSVPVAEAFFAMRQTADKAGPLDAKTIQLCLLAGFAGSRNEGGFRVHCTRAIEAGATKEEIMHVVLIMLGSNLGLSPTVDTLRWAKEELEG